MGVAIQGRVQGFIALCSTLPRDSWDANLHLMLKLLGSSYASGIERVRYQRHFHQLEERNELALHGVRVRPESDGDGVLVPLRQHLRDAPVAGGFERVLEVVPADESARGPLRERWKHYKARGLEVNKHDM